MSLAYQYEVYEHLLRLWMCIWLYTHTNTTTDVTPDLWVLAEILPDASVQTTPLSFLLRLLNLSDFILCPWYTYMRCLSTCSDCGWAYGFTFTSLPPLTHPQPICESWLKSYLMQVSKPCHYTLVEAVEPFKLHPMSMSYIYERFEHLLRLWMGIWLHIQTITSTDTSPDLWELAEILPYAIVQTMPLQGCKTLQTAFHLHVIHV